jgi:PII-like signaling protein
VKLEGEQVLLRVHLSSFEKWHTGTLYEALVEKARRDRLSGATVLAGVEGFFGSGPMLGGKRHLLRLERPVVVEIVDSEEALQGFLAAVEPMLRGRSVLVTLERARVIHYRGGEGAGTQ